MYTFHQLTTLNFTISLQSQTEHSTFRQSDPSSMQDGRYMNLTNAATRSGKGVMLEGVGFVITLITRDETV